MMFRGTSDRFNWLEEGTDEVLVEVWKMLRDVSRGQLKDLFH